MLRWASPIGRGTKGACFRLSVLCWVRACPRAGAAVFRARWSPCAVCGGGGGYKCTVRRMLPSTAASPAEDVRLGWLARRGPRRRPCRQRLLAARRSACCVFLLGAFFPLLPALLFDDVLVAFFGLPWLLFDDVLVAFFGASSSPPSRFWLARFFSLCDVFLRGASLRFGGLDPQPPIVVVATVGGAGRRGVVCGVVGWGRLPWAAVSLALSRRVMRVLSTPRSPPPAVRCARCSGDPHGACPAVRCTARRQLSWCRKQRATWGLACRVSCRTYFRVVSLKGEASHNK